MEIILRSIVEILAAILLYILVAQLATIIHEFGHAIPARIFSKDKVTIYLGVGDNERKFEIGDFIVIFRRFHPVIGFVFCNNENCTRLGKIITSLGGPLVSLLICIGGWSITRNVSNTILNNIFTFIAEYSLFQFIVTIIPIRYPSWWGAYAGKPSDGYRIVALLKEGKKTIS